MRPRLSFTAASRPMPRDKASRMWAASRKPKGSSFEDHAFNDMAEVEGNLENAKDSLGNFIDLVEAFARNPNSKLSPAERKEFMAIKEMLFGVYKTLHKAESDVQDLIFSLKV